jgi:hypothetical protein
VRFSVEESSEVENQAKRTVVLISGANYMSVACESLARGTKRVDEECKIKEKLVVS